MRQPSTPFSTRLSGSAKETQLRIRGIFQFQKKRPPLWLLALVMALTLGCGGLVSCQQAQPSTEPPTPQEDTTPAADTLTPDDILDLLEGQINTNIFPEGFDRQLVDSIHAGSYTTHIAAFFDGYPHYTYVIGVTDQTGQLTGPVYTTGSTGGSFRHRVLTEKSSGPRILYTISSMTQGYSYGVGGVVEVTPDGQLTWTWPVEGSLLESAPAEEYQTYWEGKKPLMSPCGLDIFVENENFGMDRNSPPQWTADHNQIFWHAPENDLPMPVYFQVRTWLESFTRSLHNPYQGVNSSAQWCIESLTPMDGIYHDSSYTGRANYKLIAKANDKEDLYFSARLRFDHETGEIGPSPSIKIGSYEDIYPGTGLDTTGDPNAAARNDMILEYIQSYRTPYTVRLLSDYTKLAEGELAITDIEFLGDASLDESIGELYNVILYYPPPSILPDSFTVVLLRSADGTYDRVLGSPNFNTKGMTPEEIIQQVSSGQSDFSVTPNIS